MMEQELQASSLGREATYPERVDAGALFAVRRDRQRQPLGLGDGGLPFVGEDRWTAWELSWLEPGGKPVVAIAELTVPADSPCLIESKSLKLYLNGYAQTRLAGSDEVVARLAGDLGRCAGAPVGVALRVGAAIDAMTISVPPAAIDLDRQALAIDHYGPPQPGFLTVASGGDPVEQCLHSRLFRSNCPVTGQPDWADIQIRYRGRAIDQAGLLRYLVSYRRHREFHESCVERIYLDLRERCRPDGLCVAARFTRRGGLDINPWRGTPGLAPPTAWRSPRQ